MKFVSLSDYEQFSAHTTKNSKYEKLFTDLKGTLNQWVNCADYLQGDRTLEHNKTNISSCAGKWAKREENGMEFQWKIVPLLGSENKDLIVRVTKNPAYVAKVAVEEPKTDAEGNVE